MVEIPAGHRLIYLSGQVPLDSAGKVVGPGDFRRQAEQVFANLERALAAVGATFADVVKVNYYVLDIAKLSDLRTVRDRYVSQADPPASTLVEVQESALAIPHLDEAMAIFRATGDQRGQAELTGIRLDESDLAPLAAFLRSLNEDYF